MDLSKLAKKKWLRVADSIKNHDIFTKNNVDLKQGKKSRRKVSKANSKTKIEEDNNDNIEANVEANNEE